MPRERPGPCRAPICCPSKSNIFTTRPDDAVATRGAFGCAAMATIGWREWAATSHTMACEGPAGASSPCVATRRSKMRRSADPLAAMRRPVKEAGSRATDTTGARAGSIWTEMAGTRLGARMSYRETQPSDVPQASRASVEELGVGEVRWQVRVMWGGVQG